MTEREVIDEILYDFLYELVGGVIIFENENGVRPKPPFLSIDYTAVNTLGTIPYHKERMVLEDNKFVETTVQPVERFCTLRAFGKGSESTLNRIRDLLQFETYIDKLKLKDIVIKNIDDIVVNNSVYSKDEETFYSLDCVISYARVTQLENQYISGVKIDSEVVEPNGEKHNTNIIVEED